VVCPYCIEVAGLATFGIRIVLQRQLSRQSTWKPYILLARPEFYRTKASLTFDVFAQRENCKNPAHVLGADPVAHACRVPGIGSEVRGAVAGTARRVPHAVDSGTRLLSKTESQAETIYKRRLRQLWQSSQETSNIWSNIS
jgi:hypothetical protein